MLPTSVHLAMFAITVLTGAILGAAFDWHRAWCATLRLHGWAAHAWDAAFVPIAAVIVGIGILAATWGELRAFTFLGLGVGAWIYARLASPVLLPLATGITRGTWAAATACARAATWPWRLGSKAAAHVRSMLPGARPSRPPQG